MTTIIVAKKILSTRSPKLRLVCRLCSVRLNGVAVAYGWTCMCTVSNSTTSLPQYKACEHRLFLIRNSNNLPSGVPFSRSRQSWWFHVVVLQRTTKKLTKVQYARAELLFCPLDLSVIFCCFCVFHRKINYSMWLPTTAWQRPAKVIQLWNVVITFQSRYGKFNWTISLNLLLKDLLRWSSEWFDIRILKFGNIFKVEEIVIIIL